MADAAGERFGPYVLERELGRGGMGVVYLAHDEVRNRTVALKVLARHLADDAVFRARFQRESRVAARLSDPHVIPIHDFGEIDGRLYLDMRLVRGRDLSELIAAGPLDPDTAVGVVSQVADALDAAHAAGLVHRDVKPANILLAEPDRPGRPPFAYLVDFGIAHTADASARLTTSGAMGTIAYLAPERLLGDAGDGRADVYALGCVLFEALTGRRPFEGETGAVLYGHVHLPPPDPAGFVPGLPAALSGVVARALAKSPGDRYATAGEFADAVAHALRAVPPTFATPGAADPTRRAGPADAVTTVVPAGTRPAARRRTILIAVTAALAVAVLATVLVLVTRGGDDTPAAGPPSGSGRGSGSGSGSGTTATGTRFLDPATIRTVQAEAKDGITALNTYDYRNLDASRSVALEHVTGELRTNYVDTFEKAIEPNATRLKVTQRAQVNVVGVRSASGGTAAVLAYGRLKISRSGSADRTEAFAVSADLTRVGGRWLLRKVEIVGSGDASTLSSDAARRVPGTPAVQRAFGAATTCVARLATFSRRNFDADWIRALACTTDTTRTDLAMKRDATLKTLTGGRFDLRAEVRAAGVRSAAADDVVVLVSFAGYRSDKSKPTAEQNVLVTMTEDGGEWLIRELVSVGVS